MGKMLCKSLQLSIELDNQWNKAHCLFMLQQTVDGIVWNFDEHTKQWNRFAKKKFLCLTTWVCYDRKIFEWIVLCVVSCSRSTEIHRPLVSICKGHSFDAIDLHLACLVSKIMYAQMCIISTSIIPKTNTTKKLNQDQTKLTFFY